MTLEQVINAAAEAAAKKAARATVLELKRSGAIKLDELSDYKRAETMLRLYGAKIGIDAEDAQKVERALASIAGEHYADSIQLFYLQGKTNAEVAEILHASERTVARARQRLVQKLTRIII